MDSVAQQSRVLKFGVFEVDLELGELRKHGVRLKLGGQPFEVLRILLERPQQVVTREELQKRLWSADTFVDYDLALKKAINRIREVLGDDAESPRFVETIPRRGYRFIATINANGNVARVQSPVPEGRRTQHRLKFLLLGIGIAALVIAVLAFLTGKFSSRRADAASAPDIHSLAVLPLQNLSGDPAQEYFSDGMTDTLITDLAQIGSLKVISRTSSMQYKQTRKSLPEIARELKVDGIVEGTVQRSGNRVRITAQLIYGPSDKHVWANSYEGDLRDLFAMERDVTDHIAHQIQARLATLSLEPATQPRAMSPEVLDAYLEGNYHLNRFSKGGGDEDKRKASELFQKVIDAEPTFAPGYVGMALAHLYRLHSTDEDLAVMRSAAEKAVQLDPASSDAWLALGMVKEEAWDWSGAEAGYQKAVTLNPNSASAHAKFGEFLGEIGHLDEGLKECEIAQQLDPNEDHLSNILYLRREYDRGIAIAQIMLKTHPDDGYQHLQLYYLYTKKGMYKEAVEHLEQALELFGFSEAASHIRREFALSGYTGAMRQWAKEMEHWHNTNQAFLPANLAITYAALGEKDRAYYWLEQAYQHRDTVGTDIPLPYLVRDPMADPLRSDPRFEILVRRMGIPP